MLDIIIMNEVVKIIDESETKGRAFTVKEKHFITECAYKTGDLELVRGLVANMENEKENDEKFMGHYVALYDKKTVWIDQLENLLVALEMYRLEEERALNRISISLRACGVEVSVEDIKEKNAEEIKKMVRKEVAI